MTDENKTSAMLTRLGPWILLALAALMTGGAFLGMRRAAELFNSPAMAMVWILLAATGAMAAGLALRQRRLGPALTAAGLTAVLLGGLLGSPAGLALGDRLLGRETPTLHHGWLYLLAGQGDDELVDEGGRSLGRLGFQVKLQDCGQRWDDPLALFVRGEEGDFAVGALRTGAEIAFEPRPGESMTLRVARFVEDAELRIASERSGRLAWIQPDGEMSVCRGEGGEVIRDAADSELVRVLERIDDSRRLATPGERLGVRPDRPALLLELRMPGMRPERHLLKAGNYLDTPNGAKLYYSGPAEVELVDAAGGGQADEPSASASPSTLYKNSLRGAEVELVDPASGRVSSRKLLSFYDYDLPVLHRGLPGDAGAAEGGSAMLVSRLKDARPDGVWALLSLEQREGGWRSGGIELNRYLRHRGYRFYVTDPFPGMTGMALRVQADRGSGLALAGMALAALGLLLSGWRRCQRRSDAN